MHAATLGLIVLLGAPAAEVVSPQSSESEVETLWKSAASRTACLDALTGDAAGPEPAACAQGTVAKLARGTSVRTLASTEACGSLKPVKVLSGKHTGKTGCLAPAAIKGESGRKPPL
jgi:hypothetical protein